MKEGVVAVRIETATETVKTTEAETGTKNMSDTKIRKETVGKT
jgi:hypothetical protein